VAQNFYHEPVLLNEAGGLLLWNKDKTVSRLYADCTLGGGGYTRFILENTPPDVKVLAIDRDENSIKYCKEALKDYSARIIYVNDNFANIAEILNELSPALFAYAGEGTGVRLSGAVLDAGLSTFQLESEEGFSYQKDTTLDMRAGKDIELQAKDVLNTYSEKDLLRIFKDYGELKYTRQMTRDIIGYRKKKKFERTVDLVGLLKEKIPGRYLNRDMSKAFQALRIEVNNELENLKTVLAHITQFLETGARIVCVSYHSLEDRIVKNTFRTGDEFKIITKKPVIPSKEEIMRNPRARSAKLRAAEMLK
jgi:16S rRNA (cytosine1402-N4)-methyltransferase